MGVFPNYDKIGKMRKIHKFESLVILNYYIDLRRLGSQKFLALTTCRRKKITPGSCLLSEDILKIGCKTAGSGVRASAFLYGRDKPNDPWSDPGFFIVQSKPQYFFIFKGLKSCTQTCTRTIYVIKKATKYIVTC